MSDPNLSTLLEKCAELTRRGQFHPILYDAQKGLHEYIGRVTSSTTTTTSSNKNGVHTESAQYDALRAARTAFTNNDNNNNNKSTSGTVAAATTVKDLPNVFENPISNHNSTKLNSNRGGGSSIDNLKGLFKNISLPTHHAISSGKDKNRDSSSTSERELEWCDEHFTMGCMCKVRKHKQQMFTKTSMNAVSANANANKSSSSSSANRSNAGNSIVKPNFQRPANPKSSTLASGYVEMQRRDFLTRTVWKEVLVSLVDGVKNSSDGFSYDKEPTLLIQKNEETAHGIPDLKDVAQVSASMIEDVSSMASNGEFKFSVKARGQAEEFIFRCRDEESMTNWTVTILSANDASAEARRRKIQANRQTGVSVSNNSRNVNRSSSGHPSVSTSSRPAAASSTPSQQRISIKELRAIAHGEGINTVGMERKDLERIAADVAAMRPPPPPSATIPVPSQVQRAEQERLQREIAQKERLHEQCLREHQEQEQKRRQQKLAEEQAAAEQRRKEINEKRAEEDRLRQQQKLAEKRAAEEQRRQAILNAQRAIEQKAAEDRRRAEVTEAEVRRRAAEQHAAQAKQQYHQQQQASQPKPNQPNGNFNFANQHNQQQHFHSQSQQQRPSGFAPNNTNSYQPPPQHNPQSKPSAQTGVDSPRNQKYSKEMKNLSSSGSSSSQQETITAIKRNVLGQWALNPPAMAMLRPVDQLLCTVHKVFPPAHGVSTHVYFSKWNPIQIKDLRAPTGPMTGGNIDEDKLKKSIKKLRFFLHPDKLPRDLNPEQEFVCKMVWDIINDADAEYQARKEQLDWIH